MFRSFFNLVKTKPLLIALQNTEHFRKLWSKTLEKIVAEKTPPYVAIIGAGISGISAAIRLQEKGYQVKVFERSDQIGGKCLTTKVKWNGKVYSIDIGATMMAISFQNMLHFARILQEPLFIPNPYRIINQSGLETSLFKHYWSKVRLSLFPQLGNYFDQVNDFYRRHIFKTGYRSNIPEAYEVSFAEYCQNHNMEDLPIWFDLPVAAWGYKTQETLPAWYVFGEINRLGFIDLLLTIIFGKSAFVKSLVNGHGHLTQKLAHHYRIPVQTNTEVHSIFRNEDGVVLESSQGMEAFDWVVISDPKLVNILENPSQEESDFFNELRYAPYATVLCALDHNLNAKLIVESNLKEKMAIKMIAAPFKHCPLAICYLSTHADTIDSEVEAVVTADLETLGIGLEQIYEIKLWKNFFPHFANYDGYRALLAAQGQNRTVYIGGINKFEFSDAASTTSIHLINKYFPDLNLTEKEWFPRLQNLIYWFKNN